MKATVVVSCYNQEQYIQECLDSIVNQRVDFDFEILIADDCSTDSSVELITAYKEHNPNITLLARKTNLGANRNYIDAHKRALGEVIFHFDGDDVMLPGKLQQQYNLFRNDPDVNLVFHRAQYFSDDGSYSSETGSPYCASSEVLYFDVKDLARWGSITVHSAYAYRKSSRNFVREDSTSFMEWFFAMDSLLPAGKGAYIDEILVKYRCNPSGSSYLSTKKGRKKAYNIYFNDLFYYFLKYPALRKNLYSNALVTAGGMLRSRCFPSNTLIFFIKNIFYFNWPNLKNTLQMRRAVAPQKKIR